MLINDENVSAKECIWRAWCVYRDTRTFTVIKRLTYELCSYSPREIVPVLDPVLSKQCGQLTNNITMETIECIMTRKSVRRFDETKPIAKDVLDKIVRAGFAAPSAVNARPWHFAVVTNRALLDQFAEKLPYCKFAKQAPAAIVIMGKSDKFLKAPFTPDYWIQDTSAATENILLAAHSLGLGATWTSCYPGERVAEVQSILSLDDTHIPLCVVPIGYPVEGENSKAKDKYKEEEVTYFE
ncbi:hypothetical protein KIPB_003176 [Kipferlia bialata]|uniref:Nitroreductase domain-containing protein n=1 Tax=Kipferlia bialata TaxID=797122 RepID=A0A9K3GFL3_9EUKA|nr:hypothetical protein KIPB_003176 [Kipferlia bialata]|eukprot:g3176.t1